MTLHIFGIRHHGPGSSRSLVQALERLAPDCLLVEGPPDADAIIPLLGDDALQPPVALLIYAADNPRQAAYYPFAVFSPEYQAIRYALEQQIPVRFMDLAQANQFAYERSSRPAKPVPAGDAGSDDTDQSVPISSDPLGVLAKIAGYNDGESWWEQVIEQRRDGADAFAAILEAMTALREQVARDEPVGDRIEVLREAAMRQIIRAAEKQGFSKIAVVCGAWHGPALVHRLDPKADATLLRGLRKTKVQTTFSPWTYSRMASRSGYGAGITSPGYYEHLWQFPHDITARWMGRVARLLREQDLDASAASVVEGVRLAEALSALRDRPLPGLAELNEAAQAVFCFGSDAPMRLISEKLIVGERLGSVPASTPTTPLQADVQREQKRLRMPPEAEWRDYDLDLRKPNDLDRSRLLHRLHLLDIRWGALQRTMGAKGTFHEYWRVEWQPEFAVTLIEASMWGATVAEAATALARNVADKTSALPTLTRLVDHALLADLPDAVAQIMRRVGTAAALANDIGILIDALPPLANVLRYGNVRKTDASAVEQIVDGLVARVWIGLPGACASLDDIAAATMYERITAMQRALALIRSPQHAAAWQAALRQVAGQTGSHGLVVGCCCRLLFDAGSFDAPEMARRMNQALSPAEAPARAAAWIEGALKGSGLLLIHHETLWQTVDTWLNGLSSEMFQQVLPLLRRTFATFTAPERRSMGERVTSGTTARADAPQFTLDQGRAEQALPLVTQLLGLTPGHAFDEHQLLTVDDRS